MQFEELHQKQSQWTVPDTELRESLRLAVAEVLLPAYRSFIKRYGWVMSLISGLCQLHKLHIAVYMTLRKNKNEFFSALVKSICMRENKYTEVVVLKWGVHLLRGMWVEVAVKGPYGPMLLIT